MEIGPALILDGEGHAVISAIRPANRQSDIANVNGIARTNILIPSTNKSSARTASKAIRIDTSSVLITNAFIIALNNPMSFFMHRTRFF